MGWTFKYVWHLSVEKWQKMQMNFIFPKINSTRRELTSNSTLFTPMTLQWRHNERDSVSNHQPNDCLLNRLFGRRSKKTSKPRVTGLCVGNPPVTGEFPAQMASNAENVSIWWRHHGKCVLLGIRKNTHTQRLNDESSNYPFSFTETSGLSLVPIINSHLWFGGCQMLFLVTSRSHGLVWHAQTF